MKTENMHIESAQALTSPQSLAEKHSITPTIEYAVRNARQQIQHILNHQDDRLIVVVGPCSIHDETAALEYAQRLYGQIQKHRDNLMIVMRVYFEKPRTTIGWKGLINDPYLDGSFQVNDGLELARRILLTINSFGVATGSEFLDTIIPQYLIDLTSWSAIGARTTESQIHRQLASGLPTPVGFKNSLSGDILVAVNAAYTAKFPQHFLSIDDGGCAAVLNTRGNPFCHIILRGDYNGPNYHAHSIKKATELLLSKQLIPNIMVDCSHGNSQQEFTLQKIAAKDVGRQIAGGNFNLIGMMLESHLIEGRQKLSSPKPLIYGQSITDQCLGWEDTTQILEFLSDAVRQRRSLLATQQPIMAALYVE